MEKFTNYKLGIVTSDQIQFELDYLSNSSYDMVLQKLATTV